MIQADGCGNMVVATHLIKIKGIFRDGKKREKEIKDYVLKKINNEIDSIFHPDLELFHVDDDSTTDIWVYVSSLSYDVNEDMVKKWLNDHIKEEGIEIKSFEIEKLPNEKFFVMTRRRHDV